MPVAIQPTTASVERSPWYLKSKAEVREQIMNMDNLC